MQRIAWVSGASQGIGRALSIELARQGFHVVLNARNAANLEETARQVRETGANATAVPLDVTRREELTRTMRDIDDKLGGIDLVVANAGVGTRRNARRLTWEQCAQVTSVNIDGAVTTLLALVGAMTRRRRGHLVGISSLAQYRGLPESAAYSASKAFLSGFLESLRLDLSSHDIFVTDVRPGFVDTDMIASSSRTPWKMTPEKAAQRIWKALERRSPVSAFPWPLATIVRGGRATAHRRL